MHINQIIYKFYTLKFIFLLAMPMRNWNNTKQCVTQTKSDNAINLKLHSHEDTKITSVSQFSKIIHSSMHVISCILNVMLRKSACLTLTLSIMAFFKHQYNYRLFMFCWPCISIQSCKWNQLAAQYSQHISSVLFMTSTRFGPLQVRRQVE